MKNIRTFVASYTTRYDYAYTEVRREPIYNGAQTAHENCEIGQNASKNNHEGKHSACRGQEREEPHDSSRSSIGLQHICHNSSESPGLLWGEGARCHIEQEEAEGPSCSRQGDGRRGSTHYSTCMHRSSQGICKMDVETSCRQVGEVGLCRLDLTYTGRSHPKKNEFKPHLKKCWCIPSKSSASFVAAMEDVLEVYSRPFDNRRPVVCMDEKPVQLLAEAREGFTSKSTGVRYEDNEYVRNGTCSIFLFTEPLASWRYAEAKKQRTRVDWAKSIKWLLDDMYPNADQVVLICDNLNTHNIASLYETFEPEEALRLAKRLEIHHTPKHGSWLDIAEIELSALGNQCLSKRRIDSIEKLNEELLSWNNERNANQKSVNWQFKTADARIKLKNLYPILNF